MELLKNLCKINFLEKKKHKIKSRLESKISEIMKFQKLTK
jgi:hypothetical protein